MHLPCARDVKDWTSADHCPTFPAVSKSSSKPSPAGVSRPDAPSYEEALKKLESLVEDMESGDLPLETLLGQFEEGTRLVRFCQAKLAEAELKIQQLEKTAEGELELKPFDTSPEADA
jgi:exodeoxyribonuclease VII small subunit